MDNQYNRIVDTLPHMSGANLAQGPSLEEAISHIEKIDFSLIQKKICSKA